ncbi:MAG: DUF2721 domain-containing protein [Bacteroidota bacterium]
MGILIIEILQAMLVPVVMVSACGLLLLGMNNKYSMIVNRIRLLNQEERSILEDHPTDKKDRFFNVAIQLKKLIYRMKLVRNAVFSYSIAIGFFIISSLFIGLKYILTGTSVEIFIIFFFLAGMLSVLLGIIFAALEVMKGFEVVRIEISSLKKHPGELP